MKWKCSKCGHEQPRSPKTLPEEMLRCSRYVGHLDSTKLGPKNEDLPRQETYNPGYLYCGGAPMPVD